MPRLFFYAINYATIILSSYAIPIDQIGNVQPELDTPNSQPWNRPDFVPKLLISAFLIIAGGVCAGLTIGLMGQDQVFLQVLERSGDAKTRRYASKLLKLLSKGRHWILITLLMLNVIVNETLPIVFDSVLGGGWPAVVISTVSIVIFGEIIPQALCVRYGLAIGSYFSPVVLMLMYLLYPIAKPTALLLDYLLGHHEGSVYGKKGLKTLVALHENIGIEKLDKDEVTIISSVLDLKAKAVESIMTPMKDVYTMPYDKILDQEAIDEILSQGFSRIPIYRPENKTDFVGMLLVKLLITYDPEDQWPVSRFALATLPETSASVSCLDILNFFQQGKSHMVLVSAHPGEGYGALGVLTLEDVIEELIGEEIIDETDVYIDVHKGLRRLSTPLLLNSGSRPITNVKPGALHRAATAAVHNFQKSLSQASPQQQSQMLSVSPGTIPYDQGAHKTQFILNPRNQAMNPTPYVNAKFVIKKPEDFISKPHITVKEPVEDLIAFEERDEIDAESSRSDNH